MGPQISPRVPLDFFQWPIGFVFAVPAFLTLSLLINKPSIRLAEIPTQLEQTLVDYSAGVRL